MGGGEGEGGGDGGGASGGYSAGSGTPSSGVGAGDKDIAVKCLNPCLLDAPVTANRSSSAASGASLGDDFDLPMVTRRLLRATVTSWPNYVASGNIFKSLEKQTPDVSVVSARDSAPGRSQRGDAVAGGCGHPSWRGGASNGEIILFCLLSNDDKMTSAVAASRVQKRVLGHSGIVTGV